MNMLNRLLGIVDKDRVTDEDDPVLAEFLELDRQRRKAMPGHDRNKHRQPSVGDLTRAAKRGRKHAEAAQRKANRAYRKAAMKREAALTLAANNAIDAIAEEEGVHREALVTTYFRAHPGKPSATPVEIAQYLAHARSVA